MYVWYVCIYGTYVYMYGMNVCMYACMYVYTHPYTRKNRLISYNRQCLTFNPIRLKREKNKIYIYVYKKKIRKKITIEYPTDLC